MNIGRYEVHVRKAVQGDRPSVLLVHGLGVSGDYYEKLAGALEGFCDVYVIDLPGYGTTPKPKKPLNISDLANIISAYVNELNLEGCVIIGQSMGTQIAAHALVQNPALYGGAIMVAPTANRDERTLWLQGVRLLQDTFRETFADNLVVFKNYARMRPLRFLKTARFMVNDRPEEVIARVQVPLLFVYGSKDVIAPKKWVEYLAGTAVNGRVREMRGMPHLMHSKDPHGLAVLVKEFLDV